LKKADFEVPVKYPSKFEYLRLLTQHSSMEELRDGLDLQGCWGSWTMPHAQLLHVFFYCILDVIGMIR